MAESEIERLRRETAEAQQQAAEAEQRVKGLQRETTQLRIDREIERYAQGKFKSPSAAPKMVDRKRIKVDDKGNVHGVEDAVDAVIESYPEVADAPANRGGTPPRQNSATSRSQGMFRRPTPVVPRFGKM